MKVTSKKAAPLYICIPAYHETELEKALMDLASNEGEFEVWVHLNSLESDQEAQLFNASQYEALQGLSKQLHYPLNVIHSVFSDKEGGVGLARKILMDTVVDHCTAINHTDCILACLDGDCRVNENYTQEIIRHFSKNKDTPACSINFEHPVAPSENIEPPIAAYESHLRLYRQHLRFMGHPYAFHTVGSSMACRLTAYVKQGGMNTKKAGEDFYFLNKLMHLGGFSECFETTVYPSARISTRVPFGTGRAMEEVKQGKVLDTYHSAIFDVLKNWVDSTLFGGKLKYQEELNHLDALFGWKKDWEVIQQNTACEDQRVKRFFQKFDLFHTMKFIHALRDYKYPNQNLDEAFQKLCIKMSINYKKGWYYRLSCLRDLDKSS
ncbi:glycosyltransferase [Luteibaculum oceani]|uniref:Glycosyltransferase family 2 protein n=1 Tax=Luteibaculum oceani TaxID=1294296 RepID=A0A5C6US96_9FLAO|nr:hypothetical protein [Luteibaculum oceani]TXC76107.1 hypothetical protein FRX97_11385 [Luteibaculum oceani]